MIIIFDCENGASILLAVLIIFLMYLLKITGNGGIYGSNVYVAV